jgi:hypothetical protein
MKALIPVMKKRIKFDEIKPEYDPTYQKAEKSPVSVPV